MSIADHGDQLHSQAEIASLAGVSRATVTLWRRAPGFPPPERGGDSDLFRWADVLAWLDKRPVPGRLLHGDPDGTTYGARARKVLAGKPPTAEAAGVPLGGAASGVALCPQPASRASTETSRAVRIRWGMERLPPRN